MCSSVHGHTLKSRSPPDTRMSDDLMSRARAVLASMRASREAPLREQGSDGPPAVQSTASARESVDALIARHTMRQHLQSANLQPVAQALRAAAPAPPAARAAPAAQTSARESVSALIDRHMKRQRLQSASQQSVAHIPLATAPPPSTAQAGSMSVRYPSPDHTRARRVDVLGRDAGSARSQVERARSSPPTRLQVDCADPDVFGGKGAVTGARPEEHVQRCPYTHPIAP